MQLNESTFFGNAFADLIIRRLSNTLFGNLEICISNSGLCLKISCCSKAKIPFPTCSPRFSFQIPLARTSLFIHGTCKCSPLLIDYSMNYSLKKKKNLFDELYHSMSGLGVIKSRLEGLEVITSPPSWMNNSLGAICCVLAPSLVLCCRNQDVVEPMRWVLPGGRSRKRQKRELQSDPFISSPAINKMNHPELQQSIPILLYLRLINRDHQCSVYTGWLQVVSTLFVAWFLWVLQFPCFRDMIFHRAIDFTGAPFSSLRIHFTSCAPPSPQKYYDPFLLLQLVVASTFLYHLSSGLTQYVFRLKMV